jgi:hypothetical protein
MANSAWGDVPYLAVFRQALNTDIRLEITRMQVQPKTLDELIQAASKFDQLLHPERQQFSLESVFGSSPPPSRGKPPQSSSQSPTVDMAKVLEKEQYLKEGLCFHCGKKGHIARNCPSKPDPTQRVAATKTSSIAVQNSNPVLIQSQENY